MELKLNEIETELERSKEPEDVEKLKKERNFYQSAYRKISEKSKFSDEHITTEHVTGFDNN